MIFRMINHESTVWKLVGNSVSGPSSAPAAGASPAVPLSGPKSTISWPISSAPDPKQMASFRDPSKSTIPHGPRLKKGWYNFGQPWCTPGSSRQDSHAATHVAATVVSVTLRRSIMSMSLKKGGTPQSHSNSGE